MITVYRIVNPPGPEAPSQSIRVATEPDHSFLPYILQTCMKVTRRSGETFGVKARHTRSTDTYYTWKVEPRSPNKRPMFVVSVGMAGRKKVTLSFRQFYDRFIRPTLVKQRDKALALEDKKREAKQHKKDITTARSLYNRQLQRYKDTFWLFRGDPPEKPAILRA